MKTFTQLCLCILLNAWIVGALPAQNAKADYGVTGDTLVGAYTAHHYHYKGAKVLQLRWKVRGGSFENTAADATSVAVRFGPAANAELSLSVMKQTGIWEPEIALPLTIKPPNAKDKMLDYAAQFPLSTMLALLASLLCIAGLLYKGPPKYAPRRPMVALLLVAIFLLMGYQIEHFHLAQVRQKIEQTKSTFNESNHQMQVQATNPTEAI